MSYLRRLLSARDVDSRDVVVVDDMRFLSSEKLGDKQSLTPEGFLLIQDTPVARTGWQIYAPNEIPDSHRFAHPPDGVFRVWRDPEEVFAPEAMASGNAKPIVDEHPEQIITPDTHAGAPGVGLDPRRGSGSDDDVLVMDLMVYNKDLIDLIRAGKRELSLGYDVEYEELAPGKLAQKNIRINHIALVDSGRCGPRCAIGDRQPQLLSPAEEVSMAKKRKVGDVFDSIRRVLMGNTTLSAKDKEELEKVLKKEEDELPEALKEHEFKPEEDESVASGAAGAAPAHHIELHNHMPAPEKDDDEDGEMEERMGRCETAIHELAEMIKEFMSGAGEREPAEGATTDDPAVGEEGEKILGQLELEAPPGAEAGDVRGAKDSRYLVDSFQATSALSEIIAPGIRLPTFDRAGDPKKNFKVVCDLRRSALTLAYGDHTTRGLVEDVLGAGRTFDVKKMSCDAVRSAFLAVGAMKKAANNRTLNGGTGVVETRRVGDAVGGMSSITDYQKMLNEHYKKSA